MDAEIKTCAKCKEVKTLFEFGRLTASRDGLHYYCKQCTRELSAAQYRKDPQRASMYSVAQYKKNRQKIIRRAAVWYKKNTQRVKERNAARYKKDPQKVAICVTTWQQNNPKRYRQIQERAHRRRRARLANVEFDPTITLDVVYRRDDGVCQICDELVVRYEASIDHIIPVSRDGAHTWDNVQLAHRTCNRKKGANLQEAAA